MGAPRPFHLIELGPGRGTLIRDALRAIDQALPDCAAAAELHLVETSPTLIARQRRALRSRRASWTRRFADVPPGPLLAVANEFFDALPIRQFERHDDGWHERLVDVAPDGGFRFVSSARLAGPPAVGPDVLRRAGPGDVAEICKAGGELIREMAERVARFGGGALVVDYGYTHGGPGDTLQAVKAHRYHDPLCEPGAADLTAHVDFAALVTAAGESVAVHGPITQRRLLRRLGIEQRLAVLVSQAPEDRRAGLVEGYRRLTDSDQMGTLFKALAMSAPGLDVPPGFEADAGDL